MKLMKRHTENILIVIIFICVLGSGETSICLSWSFQNGILVLTCSVLEAKFPISFYYNYGEILATCFIFPEPHECHGFSKNSNITYNPVNNQSTLKISDLVSINGNWSCSHGSKNDSTSIVHIVDQIPAGSTWKNTKLEETCFWIVVILVIVSTGFNILVSCFDKRLKEIKLLTKRMKLLITCLMPITVIPLSYFLKDTTAHTILGVIIVAVVAILIFVIANTGNRVCCSSGSDDNDDREESSFHLQCEQSQRVSVC